MLPSLSSRLASLCLCMLASASATPVDVTSSCVSRILECIPLIGLGCLVNSRILSLTPYCALSQCDALKSAGLTERLLFPFTPAYTAREESFFSLNERLEPACIFQPASATEVSLGLTTLLSVPECQIAIRSGGHHQALGINNIHNGVTIDMGKLKSVLYDRTSKTTTVGPGATWGDVYRYLDPMGLTVAGGRDHTVGVGGLILGGGNSFYSARKGMVCDGVASFEIVLSSGEVTTADKDTNADLWVALKGGNNNFGIVTSFELDTWETGQLWGGTVYYGTDKREALIDAFVNFGEKVDESPASSTILFWSWQPAAKGTVVGKRRR